MARNHTSARKTYENQQNTEEEVGETFFFENQDWLGQQEEKCFMIKEGSETSFPKQINETQNNPSFTAHFKWLAKFISHDNTGTFLAIINGQQIKSIADTGSYRNILSIKFIIIT